MKVNEEWSKRKFLEVNRAYLRLTQQELADLVGCKSISISFQENGRRPVKDEVIEALRAKGETLEPLALF